MVRMLCRAILQAAWRCTVLAVLARPLLCLVNMQGKALRTASALNAFQGALPSPAGQSVQPQRQFVDKAATACRAQPHTLVPIPSLFRLAATQSFFRLPLLESWFAGVRRLLLALRPGLLLLTRWGGVGGKGWGPRGARLPVVVGRRGTCADQDGHGSALTTRPCRLSYRLPFTAFSTNRPSPAGLPSLAALWQ